MNHYFKMFDPQIDSSTKILVTPGNYVICLRKNCELPDIGIDFKSKMLNGFNVIYTGISNKSLRKRGYNQHFTGNNSGRSALRKSIGSLSGFKKIPRDEDPSTGKTKFSVKDEESLTEWMKENLVLFFASCSDPLSEEQNLIDSLNPPLNLSKNRDKINSEYRRNLTLLRTVK